MIDFEPSQMVDGVTIVNLRASSSVDIFPASSQNSFFSNLPVVNIRIHCIPTGKPIRIQPATNPSRIRLRGIDPLTLAPTILGV
jgi:hypothetical protein